MREPRGVLEALGFRVSGLGFEGLGVLGVSSTRGALVLGFQGSGDLGFLGLVSESTLLLGSCFFWLVGVSVLVGWA